jgi:polysaccharide biosynthesis protein PslG
VSRRAAWVGASLAVGGLALALSLVPKEQESIPIGFNNNAVTQMVATPPKVARLISRVGADVDRVQIDWASLEPAPGRYRFAAYDAIYRADLAHGIHPLFVFAFAPNWATDGTCDSSSLHCPPTPNHYSDAARTAALIATRYPRLEGIEIWNEPNTSHFWAPAADPAAYTALLKACYAAIKKSRPTMMVAGGSMSSSPSSGDGNLIASDFLGGIYLHRGQDVMDAISVHAYPDPGDVSVESAIDGLEQVRGVRDRVGDGAIPLWVTETGMSTAGSGAVPAEVQSLVLLRLYDELRRQRGVEMVLFHTLVDPPGDPSNAETGFGVVNRDLQPKPAYCALSSAWSGQSC